LCSSFIFFFFSSRRRHTRSLRDWSSDVCSSDLGTNDHGIAYLVLYTVSRFAGGFLAASIIAIMLGVILGLNKVLFRAANPFIQIMKPISPLAWMPLLLYTVKDPKWTAVLVVFMAAIWWPWCPPRCYWVNWESAISAGLNGTIWTLPA